MAIPPSRRFLAGWVLTSLLMETVIGRALTPFRAGPRHVAAAADRPDKYDFARRRCFNDNVIAPHGRTSLVLLSTA
jgi:hypothetical protein